jgi:phosphoglycolate phosphatase
MTGDRPPLPRAVLLDWDNTLVDTWPVIHDAMNTTFAAMDRPLWTYDETRRNVRRSMRETFPEMFGEKWQAARDIFYRRFRAIHLDKLKICPGAEELLGALSSRGLYLGVVSNKRGEHLRREAAHLGWERYFARLVGANDAARDKPAPEVVDLALSGSGIGAGGEVWFVGDTGIDLECAYNAGCVPVLLRESPPQEGEFGDFGPKMHFCGCRELTALVLQL